MAACLKRLSVPMLLRQAQGTRPTAYTTRAASCGAGQRARTCPHSWRLRQCEICETGTQSHEIRITLSACWYGRGRILPRYLNVHVCRCKQARQNWLIRRGIYFEPTPTCWMPTHAQRSRAEFRTQQRLQQSYEHAEASAWRARVAHQVAPRPPPHWNAMPAMPAGRGQSSMCKAARDTSIGVEWERTFQFEHDTEHAHEYQYCHDAREDAVVTSYLVSV